MPPGGHEASDVVRVFRPPSLSFYRWHRSLPYVFSIIDSVPVLLGLLVSPIFIYRVNVGRHLSFAIFFIHTLPTHEPLSRLATTPKRRTPPRHLMYEYYPILSVVTSAPRCPHVGRLEHPVERRGDVPARGPLLRQRARDPVQPIRPSHNLELLLREFCFVDFNWLLKLRSCLGSRWRNLHGRGCVFQFDCDGGIFFAEMHVFHQHIWTPKLNVPRVAPDPPLTLRGPRRSRRCGVDFAFKCYHYPYYSYY